jgi:hypothetical protein
MFKLWYGVSNCFAIAISEEEISSIAIDFIVMSTWCCIPRFTESFFFILFQCIHQRLSHSIGIFPNGSSSSNTMPKIATWVYCEYLQFSRRAKDALLIPNHQSLNPKWPRSTKCCSISHIRWHRVTDNRVNTGCLATIQMLVFGHCICD